MWDRIGFWGLTTSGLVAGIGIAFILLDATAYPGLLGRTWNIGTWLFAAGILCGGNFAIFDLLGTRRR